MTQRWTELAEADVVSGQTVVYTGPDNAEEIYEEWSRPRALTAGHPGVIYDPSLPHVRVDWVGLEHEPISYASGFCTNRSEVGPDGEAVVPGLAKVSAEEYEERASKVVKGRPPRGYGDSDRPVRMALEQPYDQLPALPTASLFVEYGSTFPVWLFDYPFAGRRGPMDATENELELSDDLISELHEFQRNFDENFDAVTGTWRTATSERSHLEQGPRLLAALDLQVRQLGLTVTAHY